MTSERVMMVKFASTPDGHWDDNVAWTHKIALYPGFSLV